MDSSDQAKPAGVPQWAIDLGLPVGLVLVLLVVYGVDRPKSSGSGTATPGVEIQQPVAQSAAGPVRRLRLGVTPAEPAFDDMGKLLNTLGEGYKYVPFPMDDLQDFSKIQEYDVIFLTCSGVPKSWLGQRIGEGERVGTVVFTPNREVVGRVEEALKKYVQSGKTLYVSDWHYEILAGAFPEMVDQSKARSGKVQEVQAEVTDGGLRELVGPKLALTFDQPDWRPAAFLENKVSVFLRGTFDTAEGERVTAPLLVRFPYHDGTVIFTSFHNEKVNKEVESKLLRYLVFAALTAEVDSKVDKMMVRGGFSPAKKNIFSAAAEEPSVTQVYQCAKQGDLQFVVGFQNQGARLQLTVMGPDGKKIEKEGESTFTVDVPQAAVGQWTYTVKALKLPNENFPFTVTVGTK